jgi:hypothetical protein
VEALRGLEATEEFAVRVLDETELIEHLTESFHRDNPPELVESSDGLLKIMGLLPESDSLEDLYLELLGGSVLGFYDDDEGALYVVSRDEAIGGLERFTLSHEIDHALQDQTWGIDAIVPDAANEGDAALAGLSLIEGDASVLMTQWATGNLTPAELGEVVAAGQDPEQQALLDRMPAILSAGLTFPYDDGFRFVLAEFRSGNWEAVNQLYEDPPSSTEQILHPEAYATDDEPIDVTVPADLATRMGDGWSLGLEDTFGEFQTSIWLANAGANNASLSATGAAGWGGDRLAYLTGPGDADALVWLTEWDTAVDATDFEAAALREVEALPRPGRVVKTSDTEVAVIIGSDEAVLSAAVAAAGGA